MSIYSKITSAWSEMQTAYAKVSGVWQDCYVYTKVSGVWQKVSGGDIYTYPLKSNTVGIGWAVYQRGIKITSTSSEYWSADPVHGTWSPDGYTNNRYTMLLFDSDQIRSDLSGKTIDTVTLRLKRLNTDHGTDGASNIILRSHDEASLSAPFYTGDFGGNILIGGNQTLTRGQEKTITLLDSFGANLRDSIVEGIVLAILDAYDDNVDNYIKYDASRFLLTITTI